MQTTARRRRTLALGLLTAAALGLGACAAGQAPPADPGRRQYAPGPPQWDPALGTFIDPFSGYPVRGSAR